MSFTIGDASASKPREGFSSNPKRKLLDRVSEVMRLRHNSILTKRSDCDWIRRYVKFHKMHCLRL